MLERHSVVRDRFALQQQPCRSFGHCHTQPAAVFVARRSALPPCFRQWAPSLARDDCPLLSPAALPGAMSSCAGKLEHFGVASRALSSQELEACGRIVQAAKRVMVHKAKQFVKERADSPLLYSYSSDGTPMKLKVRHSVKTGSGRSSHREGGVLTELLMQKGFLKAFRNSGEQVVLPILTEPVPMDKGKTALHCYSACVSFCPLLRELGHAYICISHDSFDRALFSALDRLCRLRHALRNMSRPAVATEISPEQAAVMDWVVTTGCANHDAQHALTWGLKGVVAEMGDTLRDVYIVTESLKNSFNYLHDYLGDFLRQVVRFEDMLVDRSACYEFWVALSLESPLVELLCDLNLRWTGERLIVQACFREEPELMGKLSGAMMQLFHFRKFTESRWATIGSCSRTLVASLAVGLEGLVAYIRRLQNTSDYYIKGFARLTPDAKYFIALATCVSYVPDALLLALLEDDRAAGRVGELKDLVIEEMDWLNGLTPAFWARLAAIVGGTAGSLRADALRSASTSFAFLERKFFSVASPLPWTLAEGDILTNLGQLGNMPAIREPTARKIQILVQMGFNRHALRDGVLLLREVPWSTVGVEQGHGSAAALHRYHKERGVQHMCTRTLASMLRQLLPKPSVDRALQKTSAELQALQRRQPEKLIGRHLFFQELYAEAKATLPQGAKLSPAATRALMAKHASLYASLSASVKAGYDRSAADLASKQRAAIAEDIPRLYTQERLQKMRLSEEAFRKGVLMRTSACTFTSKDMDEIDALVARPELHGQALLSARARALEPPAVPSDLAQAALAAAGEASACCMPPQQYSPPPWAVVVCKQRDLFADCGFQIKQGGSTTYYKFIFASQNPQYVAFGPMTLADRPLPPLNDISAEDFWEVDAQHFSSLFIVEVNTVIFDSQLRGLAEADLAVLPSLYFVGGGLCGSHAPWAPWEEFAAGLPTPERQEAPATREPAARSDSTAALLKEYPWLAEYLKNRSASSSSSAGLAKKEDTKSREQGIDDETVERAFKELEAKRREMELEAPAQLHDFVVQLRGGAWTKAHTGKAYDSARGSARGQTVQQWCRSRQLPITNTFSVAKYGHQAACALAREWCRRLQWYYDGAVAANDMGHVFAPTEGPGQASDELQAMRSSSSEGSELALRVAEILALRPR